MGVGAVQQLWEVVVLFCMPLDGTVNENHRLVLAVGRSCFSLLCAVHVCTVLAWWSSTVGPAWTKRSGT